MKTLQKYKNEQMKNPEFAKAYEEIQPEMNVIRAIVDARALRNMTQKELWDKKPQYQIAAKTCRWNGHGTEGDFCSKRKSLNYCQFSLALSYTKAKYPRTPEWCPGVIIFFFP